MALLRQFSNQIPGNVPITTVTGTGNFLTPNEGFVNAISGDTSDSGIRVNNFFAYNYSAYWRALNLISGDIAQVPKHLKRRTPEGHEIVGGRISTLLCEDPNQNQTQSQFYQQGVNHLLNWGNMYAVISRDFLGRATKLTLKNPWETNVFITTESDPKQRRKLFKFSDEPKEFYLSEDVIHVYRLSLDGYVGLNPLVYALRDSIGLGKVSERYSAKFFANGGRGNGVIELKESGVGFTDENSDQDPDAQINQIRQSWEDTYGNVGGFFKLMFLEEGESYKPVNTPPEALQLLNTRVFQIGEIARIVGLPEYKLGSKEPKFANIEQQAIEYVSETLNPLCRFISDEIKKKVLPSGSTYMHFETDSLIKADIKTRYEAYSLGLGRNAPGFLTPQYVQDMEGLMHFDKSELFVPSNMVKQNYEAPSE